MISLKELLGIKKQGGKPYIYIFSCDGCGDCVQACRHDAIGFFELAEGHYAKLMHPEACSGCGRCARACENDAIVMTEAQLCNG